MKVLKVEPYQLPEVREIDPRIVFASARSGGLD